MSNLIEQLKNSSSELLKAEYSDLGKWSNLKHDKDGLELMLQFNILHLNFLTENKTFEEMICTSNTALIKILSTKKKEDKKKFVNFKGSNFNTKNKNSVMTWDLKDNKLKTISLSNWTIIDFLTISPENILILDEVIKKILKI